MKRLITFPLLVFVLASCGGSGGSSNQTLFSKWVRDDNVYSFNLAGYNFGKVGVGLNLFDGSVCATTINLTGDEKSGSFDVMGVVYVPRTGSGRDPGCSNLPRIYTYSVNGNSLSLCDFSGCATFSPGGGANGAGKAHDDYNCREEYPIACMGTNWCCAPDHPYACGDGCYKTAEDAVRACGTFHYYCY